MRKVKSALLVERSDHASLDPSKHARAGGVLGVGIAFAR
jgi:hypothetical protein